MSSFVSILSMKHRNASSFRFVNAEGLLGQIVSRDLVGPRTAAAADFDEFAMAAFAFVFVQITKVLKYGRTVPDVSESFFFDLAAVNFEISARLHLPRMRDEAKGASTQTAARRGMEGVFISRAAR